MFTGHVETRRDAIVSQIQQFTETIDRPARPEAEPAPGGSQTILFTDLEASTPLTQRLGDEGAQELLRGHNTTVRAALDEHGGREVKHTGDGNASCLSGQTGRGSIKGTAQRSHRLCPSHTVHPGGTSDAGRGGPPWLRWMG